MLKYAGIYLAIFLTMFVIDMIWLRVIAVGWYTEGMGALFGFFAYSTYDLTNLAVIKNWPVGLTFLDMAWGTLVSGVSASVGKLTLDYFNR